VTWLEAVPTYASVAAAFYLPGLVPARLLRLGWLASLALAPAISVAVLGGGAVLVHLVGMSWSRWSALGCTALAWGVAALLRRLTHGSRAPLARPRSALVRLGVGVCVVVGTAVCLGPFLVGAQVPDAMVSSWDGVYHVNLLQQIRDTGVGSTFDAAIGPRHYYPAAWHAVVALVPTGPSVLAAFLAGCALFSGPVWVLALTYLASAVVPERPVVWALTALLSPLPMGAPLIPGLVLSSTPATFATAVAPAVLGLVVQLVDAGPGRAPRTPAVGGSLVLAVAVAGLGLAHPSGLFAVALLGVPFLVAVAVRLQLSLPHRQRLVLTGGWAAVLLLAALVAIRPPALLRNTIHYPRNPTDEALPALLTVLSGAHPSIVDVDGRYWWMGLVLVGAVATATLAGRRWVVASAALAVMAFVGAVAGNPLLRVLSGPWYHDAARLATVAAVPTVLLAAIGAWRVGAWCGRAAPARLRAWVTPAASAVLLAVLAVGTHGLFWQPKQEWSAIAVRPQYEGYTRYFSPGEREMIERLPAELEPGYAVLGDPFTGSALVYALTDYPVVFPALSGVGPETPAQTVAREDLADLGSDPRVCSALQRLGARYLYTDTSTWHDESYGYTPLAETPVPESARLVDSGGTASVYELTACRWG
jgi:hypothetical protein